MLPVKSTKAQLQAANEILVCAVEQLMNRVAELEEQLKLQYRPDASTRQNHDRLLQHIFKELGYNARP